MPAVEFPRNSLAPEMKRKILVERNSIGKVFEKFMASVGISFGRIGWSRVAGRSPATSKGFGNKAAAGSRRQQKSPNVFRFGIQFVRTAR